jgi:hypothetical protein
MANHTLDKKVHKNNLIYITAVITILIALIFVVYFYLGAIRNGL